MDLMSLMVKVGADISGATKGLSDVESKMSGTAKTASSFTDKLKSGFSSIATAGAALGAGVAAAAGTLTKFATDAAATTDHIDKMSQKIGISRKAYQEMDFVLSQSGTSVDSLQAGMKTLRTSMTAAQSGTKANVATFKKLGVAVTDASGNLRSTEDVMFDTLSALQKVDNETERAALATKLFGKSGAELAPLLNSGAGSIEEMRQKAHDLGLVLGDDAIDTGVKLTDTIDQVKRSFSAIITTIGVSFMPVVQNVLDIVLNNMPQIQSVLSTVFSVLGTLVSGAVSGIKSVASVISSVIAVVSEKVVPTLKTFWTNTLVPIGNYISGAFTTAWDAIVSFFNGTIAPAIETLKTNFDTFKTTVLKPLGTYLAGAFKTAWEGIKAFFSDTLPDAITTVMAGFTLFKMRVLEPLGAYLSGTFSAAWEGIKSFFSDTLPDAINAIMAGFTLLKIRVLEPLGAFLANTFSAAWNAISDFFTNTLPPAITAIQTEFETFKNTYLVPLGDFLSQTFLAAWEGIQTFFSDTLPTAIATVKIAFFVFKSAVLEPLGEYIGGKFADAWAAIKDYWENDLSPRLQELKDAFDTFKTNVLEPLGTFLTDTFSAAWEGIVSLFGGESQGGGVGGAVASLGATLSDLYENYIKPVAEYVSGTFSTVWETWKGVINGIITFLTGAFKGDWERAWNGLVDAFGSIFNGIKELVKTPLNAVIGFLNGLIGKVELTINRLVRGINGALTISIPRFAWDFHNPFTGALIGSIGFPGYSWRPGLSGVTFGRIPLLAKGGTVMDGGHAIVGEAGPEYLRVVNGQAVVTPMKGMAGGGNTYNNSINIYQQPGENAEELAERVQRVLARQQRQRRSVYA